MVHVNHASRVTRYASRLNKERVVFMKKYSIILSILLIFLISYFLSDTRESRGVDVRILAISSFNIIPDSPGERYVGTGLADTVITKLSTIEGLRLIERTQLERAKKRIGLGQDEMITEDIAFKLADMLKADIVMLGTIQASRDKFKVSTKTLDAKTKDIKVFTSDSIYMGEGIKGIENNIEPLNNVHDQIARNVTDIMGVKLSEKQEEAVKKDFTASGSAYISYAKARDFYVRYTKEDNEKAIELFQNAINIDPSYALAWAGLGDACAQKAGPFKSNETGVFEKSIEASKKAIELDPDLPEGYKSLALAYTYRGVYEKNDSDINEAISNYNKALEFNSYYVDAYLNLGKIYVFKGDVQKALVNCQKALELDPGYSHGHLYMGIVYMKQEKHKDSLSEFDRSIELENQMKSFDSTVVLNASVLKGMSLIVLQKYDDALTSLNRALEINPDYPVTHFALGTLYALQDDKIKAEEEINIYLKLDPNGEYAERAKEILEKMKE